MPPRSTSSTARLSVLDAVRRGHRTVTALAADLGVTDNAVRLHLAALERDRLLARQGPQRSGRAGQPAALYALTAEGEQALSRAYPAAFTALVGALGARLEARAVRGIFAEAGRRLAASAGDGASGSLAQRVAACAALFESLGGHSTIDLGRKEAVITGAGCPLAAAVRAEPTTCTLIEALLERHAGVNATQQCDRGAAPRCRFRITAAN
jgi:predicted ArsR family transcriptional regulator